MPRNSIGSDRVAPLGVSDASSTSLRQLTMATQAASGVVFLNDKMHIDANSKHFADAIDYELANALIARRGTSNIATAQLGPCETVRSRTMALTLCLPHKTDLAERYANATAAIVLHRPENAEVPKKRGRSRRLVTHQVRFGIVAGENDICNVLSTWSNTSTSSDWSTHPCMVVHYMDGAKQQNCLFKLGDANVVDVEAAVREIRDVCIAAQRQSGGKLTFPAVLIDKTIAIGSHISEVDALAQLQQEIQNDVHAMCFPPTESTATTAQSFYMPGLPGSSFHKMFVRVVRHNQQLAFKADDPTHSVGIMLTVEKEASTSWDTSYLRSFMMRARRVEQPSNFGEWPIYGLPPPEESELVAAPHILWFASETNYVGDNISTYGIRPTPTLGEAVTAFGESHIECVRARFQPLQALLGGRCMVLPCSCESAVSNTTTNSGSDLAVYEQFAKLHTAFNQYMSTRLDEIVKKSSGPSPLVHSHSQASEMSVDYTGSEDPEQAVLMALFSIPPGLPCTTVNDLYAALGEHTDAHSRLMRGYHTLLTKAISLGRGGDTVKRLLDDTVESMESGLAKKQRPEPEVAPMASVASVASVASTGTTGATPVVPVDDGGGDKIDLTHLFDTEASRDAMFATRGLVKLACETLPYVPDDVGRKALTTMLDNCAVNSTEIGTEFATWVEVIQQVVRMQPSATGATARATYMIGVHRNDLAKRWKPPKLLEVTGGANTVLSPAEILKKRTSEARHFLFWFSKVEEGHSTSWRFWIYAGN